MQEKKAVNVGESKVMRIGKNLDVNEVNISLNDRMEAVECYRYLGVDILNDGRMNEEVRHRIEEVRTASRGLQKFLEE